MSEKKYTYYDLMAARDIAGDTITKIGKQSDKIVVVNSDLMRSSRTQDFAETFPERAFNVGIAEQEMVSFAAGLASDLLRQRQATTHSSTDVPTPATA